MTVRRLFPFLGVSLFCLATASLGIAALIIPVQFVQDFSLIDPATGLQAVYTVPNTTPPQKFPLWVGLGSSAHHRMEDDQDVITVITDRGPNADYLDGKLFPFPAFTPTIYRLKLHSDHYTILDTIPIVGRHGEGLNGLANYSTDITYGPDGLTIGTDPNGVDIEGVVRLNDGSYWISEENAPSLLHVSHKGKVLERVIPAGSESSFVGASYPVSGGLPAILAKRRSNRGFESLALSHNEKSLFALVQSPLDNPKTESRLKGNNRLIQYSLKDGKTIGEYVYVEETPAAYFPLNQPNTGPGDPLNSKQGDVKVGELVTVAPGVMVVKEGVEKATKLFVIRLEGATNILGTKWDTNDQATGPNASLEVQVLPNSEIVPVSKQLIFDSRTDMPTLTSKIESVAYFGHGLFLLINDNDFGIAGFTPTQFTWVHIDPALLH